MIISTPQFSEKNSKQQIEELQKAMRELIDQLNMILPDMAAEKEARNVKKP